MNLLRNTFRVFKEKLAAYDLNAIIFASEGSVGLSVGGTSGRSISHDKWKATIPTSLLAASANSHLIPPVRSCHYAISLAFPLCRYSLCSCTCATILNVIPLSYHVLPQLDRWTRKCDPSPYCLCSLATPAHLFTPDSETDHRSSVCILPCPASPSLLPVSSLFLISTVVHYHC